MSKRIQELESKRGAVRKDQAAIIEKARAETRELSGEEIANIKKLREQEENLTETLFIENRNLASEASAQSEVEKYSRSEKKDIQGFSFARAFNALLNGQPLDGIEGEMHQEAQKMYRAHGLTMQGNFIVPPIVTALVGSQQRDLTATGGTSGSQGGVLIPTTVGSIIEVLRNKTLLDKVGVTRLDNLVGNVAFPVEIADDQAVEKAETATANESSPTFSSKSLSPHRLPVFAEYSRQLLAQTNNPSIEAFLRNDLGGQIARRQDLMALTGTGSSNQPTGILSTSGIGSVVGGTNGAVPDWADLVDLETAVSTANADMGNLAYVMTPGIRGKLKKTIIDAGSGQFIWPANANEINGYKVVVSNQVPSTLTKGTSAGTAHAIIFGNWADLVLASWGGIEFLINPYSRDTEGLIRINAWTFYDVLVRRPQSFAAMVDALTA